MGLVGAMDFVALDVETANADLASICAVGLVHFRSGAVYRSLRILVDPQDHFDAGNIAIHGITPDRVQGKPTMREVIPAIAASLARSIIVHHTAFDRGAFQKAAQRADVPMLDVEWLDSARVARRAWAECADRGYGLSALAMRFGISFDHHDPVDDARVAGLIVLRAIADTGVSLQAWCERLDGPIEPGCAEWRPYRDGRQDGPLAGETVAFTGQLHISRSEAADLAAKAGCDVRGGVTKQTTLLVVGDQDVRLLHGHAKSTKQLKAEKLIAEGFPIRIIGETDFVSLLGGARSLVIGRAKNRRLAGTTTR
jgi:DNA polymerase III subunit epsilon